MSDWVALARKHGMAVNSRCGVRFLDAFDRGDRDVGVVDFAEVLVRCEQDAAMLDRRIPEVLCTEVDLDQASLFARRFRSVRDLLRTLPEPDGQLLGVGLVRRTAEVMEDEAPRALRVRAVADFYYSQAARAVHRTEHPTSFEGCVGRIGWRDLAPGVRHGVLMGPGPVGPLHVNLLEVRGRRLSMVDCRPEADLAAVVARAGAVAAVSGGFFLYSEPDIHPPCKRTDPVGLLADAGCVINPPVFSRASLLQFDDGSVRIERVGLLDCTVRVGSAMATIGRVNVPGEGVGAWTRAATETAPEAGVQVVGCRAVGVGTEVPVGGFVLTGFPVEPGRMIDLRLPFALRSGVAGGPMLLHPTEPVRDLLREDFCGTAPPVTFSRDETYDQNLLPRMGVGTRSDGSLLFAAVDGRDLHRAPGLTLSGTADLLAALDCEVGMNLDGGSSKRMVAGGTVVDRPSTDVLGAAVVAGPPRPVHTAILVG